jgi:hypothetical protein
MPGFFETLGNFFTGSKGRHKQKSRLRPSQEPLAEQAINAGLQPGAGGAYGTSADYYRNLLSDNPADLEAFSAPALRQFNEEIIPGLSEQFAGMGAGGLDSSGFRNAAVNAGTDLSERLGAIRANLRQAGAQGLQNIGQAGLQQFDNNIYEPGTPGLLDYAGQAIGNAGSQFAGNWLSNKAGINQNPNMTALGGNKVGRNTSWMGKNNQMPNQNGFQFPNFNNGMR